MARVPHPIKPHPAMTYKEPLMVRVGRYSMTTGLVLLVLSVLYILAWFVTSMSLRSGLQDWFNARQSEGYLASYEESKARISGFPFHVKASLSDVVFAPPKDSSGKRPWIWSPDKVDFMISPLPWNVTTLGVDLSHQQNFQVEDLKFEGRAKTFILSFNWLSKGVPDDLSLKIEGLRLAGVGHGFDFAVQEGSLAAERDSNGDYVYDLNLAKTTLPKGIAGLGYDLDEVILRGRFTQNFAATGFSKQDWTSWRDQGGTVEAERNQISYGPLMMQGNGTLALDGDLQLVGAFSTRIQGFFEALDRMNRARVISGPANSMARVVLGGLLKHPQNGGAPTISLPLTLQERALYAGPVRLLDMPVMNWD